ncbi:hypothetical protein C1J05_04140 [Sulfitobacter sp. JL08]|nr:hypothetical protein C1J05_04140 [Sulfitobacter sp. JL08]
MQNVESRHSDYVKSGWIAGTPKGGCEPRGDLGEGRSISRNGRKPELILERFSIEQARLWAIRMNGSLVHDPAIAFLNVLHDARMAAMRKLHRSASGDG